MKAGRELDAKIASEVFGWKVKQIDVYGWMYSLPGRNRWMNVPHFSTNIADAWLVVEKLKERLFIRLAELPNGNWDCYFAGDIGTPNNYTEAETAPLAICLAALKAVGYESEEVVKVCPNCGDEINGYEIEEVKGETE